jgi:Uma2 family endonuclease
MKTILKIGPSDHGRPMTLDEFEAAAATEGYQYELIDGQLYVSPQPDLPQNQLDEWMHTKLAVYSSSHLEVINYVSGKARVFVSGRPGVTNPEPDVAAYQNFPLDLPFSELAWQDVHPVLVVEVLSVDDPDKDSVRNLKLYLQVPSIKEYWVIDSLLEGPERPHLRIYRRTSGRWRALHYGPGATYTTRLLPGFSLVVDPRR